MTGPDFHGEAGLYPRDEGKEEDVWNAGDPLGHCLYFLGLKSMGNYNYSIQAGM